MRKITFLAMLAAVPLLAQMPRIENGAVTTAPAQRDLRRQIESSADGWVGYQLPARDGKQCYCSYGDSINISDVKDDLRVASSHVGVFFRVTNHRIDRVRLRSESCALDAEGKPVMWIEGVDAAANVAFLEPLVRDDIEDQKHALVALAISKGSSDALIDIARHHPSPSLRGKALFWVGQQAGEKAAATLKDAVENDPEDSVKAKAVFGIYNLPDDQSVPMLIDLMKTHSSRAVRKKAAFWLSQKHDPRALEAFRDILAK